MKIWELKSAIKFASAKRIFRFAELLTTNPAERAAVFARAREFLSRKKRLTKPKSRKTAGASGGRFYIRTSDNPTALAKELRELVKGTTLRVRSYRESQENLNEQFAKTENYLSLTGLFILVLGGVGVWNVARVFVEQKQKAIAVLKCLGAGANKIIAVYLLQIIALGFIGSLFGVFLAQCALWLAQNRFAAELPEKMSYVVPLSAALQGVLLGVLISLLFSALPLLQVQKYQTEFAFAR